MRRRYTDEQFVTNYMKAYKAGKNYAQLAQDISISVQFITQKVFRLRNRGVELPKLRRVGESLPTETLNEIIKSYED